MASEAGLLSSQEICNALNNLGLSIAEISRLTGIHRAVLYSVVGGKRSGEKHNLTLLRLYHEQLKVKNEVEKEKAQLNQSIREQLKGDKHD